jgi:hypothetical protein
VTFGKSLYLDCLILWMRHKTETPCTWVSMPARACKRSHTGGKCVTCTGLPLLQYSRSRNWAYAHLIYIWCTYSAHLGSTFSAQMQHILHLCCRICRICAAISGAQIQHRFSTFAALHFDEIFKLASSTFAA